ncbi:metalloendoproteinase 3-MMP-like [Primulina huaijiensis]|uniref:metalloendoproteinase 3-MMP-like n=1 Tax=Primulina huaijiensis TaxID=1492673 RepID=UPI003CC73865
MYESSCYTFYPGSPRWPGRRIRYAFSRNVEEHVKQPLEHALQRWASVSPSKFYRVKKFAQADIWISFLRGYHGDEFPFDGANGHVAHAFGTPDGRVHFDSAQNWSISKRDNDGLDMETLGFMSLGIPLGSSTLKSKRG